MLYYCKRVIYGTYFLLPLVHKQFVRGSFFETGEVSEWQSYGIGSEKRYYMLRNAANAVLCVNITKYVKMTGHWNRRYLWERSLSALKQAMIISRQVEVVIVICINNIRKIVYPIAVHHLVINRIAVLLRVVRVALVLTVVSVCS